MSFSKTLEQIPFDALLEHVRTADAEAVESVLSQGRCKNLFDLAVLLSDAAGDMLERVAKLSRAVTLKHFGRTISIYAPLYLSNECSQDCVYCGFRAPNKIVRRTLSMDEALSEAEVLRRRGIRHLLLVSGEHPKVWGVEKLRELIARLSGMFPSVSIEVRPLDLEAYSRLREVGLDGLTLYQETYDRALYDRVHRKGRKKDFDARLNAVESGASAGLKRIGLGALLGLGDWRKDVLALAAHARYMEKRYWRTFFTVSLPRMKPAAGAMDVPAPVSDRELARIACALRIALPETGLVISTRERAEFRDGLARLGVTQMSAGSSTEPGGYRQPDSAGGQFEVEDHRSPAEVAENLRRLGYDPVFKDWEAVLNAGYNHQR